MFRRYAWAALAFAAVACGDSDDSKPTADAGSGAAADGAVDASIPVTPEKSTETGKACTAATECAGVAGQTQCLTTVGGQLLPAIEFEGGYCSAVCTDDSECNTGTGTAAGCPGGNAVKQAQAQLAGLGAAASFILPQIQQISVCLQKCDVAAPSCREGYVCDSLQTRLSAAVPAGGDAGTTGGTGGTAGFNPASLISSFIGNGTFCLPEETAPAEDGGVVPTPDAGEVPQTDAGVDAGEVTPDAGADIDAGDAGV